MEEFVEALPEGYHDPIKKQVITMASNRTSVAVNNKKTLDESMIFSRALGLMVTGAIDPPEIFENEMAGYPTSLFKKWN